MYNAWNFMHLLYCALQDYSNWYLFSQNTSESSQTINVAPNFWHLLSSIWSERCAKQTIATAYKLNADGSWSICACAPHGNHSTDDGKIVNTACLLMQLLIIWNTFPHNAKSYAKRMLKQQNHTCDKNRAEKTFTMYQKWND